MSRRTLNRFMLIALTVHLFLQLVLVLRGLPWDASAFSENGRYLIEGRDGDVTDVGATDFWLATAKWWSFCIWIAIFGVYAYTDERNVVERTFPSLREKAKKGAAGLLTGARGES